MKTRKSNYSVQVTALRYKGDVLNNISLYLTESALIPFYSSDIIIPNLRYQPLHDSLLY